MGEIIGLNDGLCYWKKGGKTVSFKQTPLNFVDRNAGTTLYESQDFLKYVKIYFDPDIYLLEDIYPIHSKNWLLYYGAKEKINYYDKTEYEALLLPLFNNPKVTHLNGSDLYIYKSEYFFYHDSEYIVYRRQTYGDTIFYDIVKKNGAPVQQVPLKITGAYDASYVKIYTSPSGRYSMYIEDTVNPENSETKTAAKIVELVQDVTTKEFKFMERRTIEDFYERYNKRASSVNSYYDYYSIYDFFLSDKMEILFINKTDKILMYEEIKLQNEVEKKLGKRDWNQEEFRDLGDINYTMKNGGFALYSSEEVFFLRINSDLRTVMPLVRINFKLNKAQMTVNSVCA